MVRGRNIGNYEGEDYAYAYFGLFYVNFKSIDPYFFYAQDGWVGWTGNLQERIRPVVSITSKLPKTIEILEPDAFDGGWEE